MEEIPGKTIKRIIYTKEWNNMLKLANVEQFDFCYDMSQIELKIVDMRKYLITPTVPGISISDFVFDYIIYENGKRRYKIIEFEKWYNIVKAVIQFSKKMRDFHKYFTHNDIHTGNLVYDENERKIYLLDFEVLKEIQNSSDDKDFRDIEKVIKELIELGVTNPEIRQFCLNFEILDEDENIIFEQLFNSFDESY